MRVSRTATNVGLTVLALMAIGWGLAQSPLLAAGLVFGTAVIAATLAWPVVILGSMLVMGPVDISALTGGVRGLLPALGGLDMSGIRLVALTGALGTLIFTRRDLLRRLIEPDVRWYTVFLVWGGVSLGYSADPLEGLRLLLKIAYPLLVYVVLTAPERSAAELRKLADWALWGATALLLINPFVIVNGGYAFEAGTILRVGGPGAHFNPFSFYLLAILMICVARFRTRGQLRYMLLGAMAVLWMTLALTRITFLASMIAVGVAALYVAILGRSFRWLIGMTALGLVVGGLVIRGVLERSLGYVPTGGQLLALMADPVALYNAINWEGRETLWGILWVAFLRSPLIGSGMGTSTATLAATLGEGAPHNEYLRLAVDVGVIGVVLYFLAVIAWIRAVWRVIVRASSQSRIEEFALPALSLLFAWAVIAATDNPFDYYAPFTQYIAFMAASAVTLGRQPQIEAEPESTLVREALTASVHWPG